MGKFDFQWKLENLKNVEFSPIFAFIFQIQVVYSKIIEMIFGETRGPYFPIIDEF